MNRHIDADELQFLKYIPTGGIHIDIGAGDGGWTEKMLEKADIVFAIEPDNRLTHKLLSLPKNKLWIFPLVLSEKHEKTQIYIREEYRTGITTKHHSPLLETKEIFTTTLDEIEQITTLINKQITFIKIDTEGAEHLILKGATKTLQKHKPTLVIEYHENEKEIDMVLKQHNYAIVEYHTRTTDFENGLKAYQNIPNMS